VGSGVSEMIQGYAIAMQMESTEVELMNTIFPHPTISESMHEAVLDAWSRTLSL
jgi:dihydrolipoamide dehydrogenase